MENFFTRYKNPLVLMAVLFVQVVYLATQVHRPEDPKTGNSPTLIRVWTVTTITPFERAFVSTGRFIRGAWHNYLDLHGVRQQNLALENEVAQLKLAQTRLRQDAEQAQRLQALLGFKERYIGQTMAAQVIGSSGSEQSRVVYIDKGSRDGMKPDMAVVTPDGIVGKIKDVMPLSSQVLLINDHDSGAGVILEKSRLHGVLKGIGLGELQVSDVMSDENIEVGEQVVTSGGDRIYPKGMPVGTISKVSADRESAPFLTIRVKPAANLNRLEEVLVVTRVNEQLPSISADSSPQRAADILAQRLPSVPKPEPKAEAKSGTKPESAAGQKPGAPAVSALSRKERPPGSVTKQPVSHLSGAAARSATASEPNSVQKKTQPGVTPLTSGRSSPAAGAAQTTAAPTPASPAHQAAREKAMPAINKPRPQPSSSPTAAPPASEGSPEKPPR